MIFMDAASAGAGGTSTLKTAANLKSGSPAVCGPADCDAPPAGAIDAKRRL